ncbi:MAG: hypothetical protein QXV44_02710 [Candidatus Anstonellaceae archaeon]
MNNFFLLIIFVLVIPICFMQEINTTQDFNLSDNSNETNQSAANFTTESNEENLANDSEDLNSTSLSDNQILENSTQNSTSASDSNISNFTNNTTEFTNNTTEISEFTNNTNEILNSSANQFQENTTNQSNLTVEQNSSKSLQQSILAHQKTTTTFSPKNIKNVKNTFNWWFFSYPKFEKDMAVFYSDFSLNSDEFFLSLFFKPNIVDTNDLGTIFCYFEPYRQSKIGAYVNGDNELFISISDGENSIEKVYLLDTTNFHSLVFVKKANIIKFFLDGEKILEEEVNSISTYSNSGGWLSFGSSSCESPFFYPCMHYSGILKNITYSYVAPSDEQISYQFSIK